MMQDPTNGSVDHSLAGKLLFWLLAATPKLLGFVAMAMAPVVAFVLGLQILPLDAKDPHRDAVRRIMGCVVSSLMLGLPALIYMDQHMAWVFDSANSLAVRADFPERLGSASVMWSVLLLGALPGWWLVGAVMRKLASWRDKDLGAIAEDVTSVVDVVRKRGGDAS